MRLTKRGGPILVAGKLAEEYLSRFFDMGVKGEIGRETPISSPYVCSFCSRPLSTKDSDVARKKSFFMRF